MKRKATITVETERLLLITRGSHTVERWCCQCNAKVSQVSVAEAALIAGASERAVFRWAETAEIHFTETEDGKAMFCVESLLRQRDPQGRKSLPLIEH